MKKFARAAITFFYNAQKSNTRKAWLQPEVQKYAEEVLHQLLQDLHPNLECGQLLAETDMIVRKHIIYHTIREYRLRWKKYMEAGEYDDQNWMPEEYVYALEGSIRHLRLADDYADSTADPAENGLNDVFEFNAVSPNASSPLSALSDSSGNIEDGEAIADPNPISGYHASQDAYSLSPPLHNAAIGPTLNTTAALHDPNFAIGTPTGIGAQLPNTCNMDEESHTMNNFISPSSWDDTHWDAFVDTETGTSTPVEEIDAILRHATSLDTQSAVHLPGMTPLNNATLNSIPDWDAFINNAPNHNTNVAGNSSAVFQSAVQAPPITQLNNTSPNWEAEWNFINSDLFIPKDNSSIIAYPSATPSPSPYNLPLPLPLPSSNATANYYSANQNINTFPNEYDFGNTAGYSSAGAEKSFDAERNATWDSREWTSGESTTGDWMTMNYRLPDLDAPCVGYKNYNVDWSTPDFHAPQIGYQIYNATF